MAEAFGLMGVGIAPEAAKRIGFRMVSLTASTTGQGGAPIIANNENVVVQLTTAGGNTATTLPSTSAVGDIIVVNVITATAALVFPPTGGTIANKSQNANVTVAIGAAFIKVSTTLWAVMGGGVT